MTEARGLASNAQPTQGGVSFSTDTAGMYRAHLGLGLAMDLRARIGRFPARHMGALVEGAAAVPWTRYLRPGAGLQLKVSCKKSRLYHTGAVAERVLEGIHRSLDPGPTGSEAPQTLYVRLHHDDCQLSLGLSGAPLYRRGYRLATGKAPLRADLARALLILAGYDGSAPLWDPLCGAGTIPIEAGLIACHRAPGLDREFAFMSQPSFQAELFSEERARLLERCRLPPQPILGADRDAGVIPMARENAARARLDGIEFEQAALRAGRWAAEAPSGGLLATHPPYGHRTKDSGLSRLYASLGAVAREGGWKLALATARPPLARAAGLTEPAALSTQHSGHRLRFFLRPIDAP